MLKITALVAICCLSLINCDPIKQRILVHFPPEVAVVIHKGIEACTVEGENVPKMIKTIHSGKFTEDAPFKRFIDCLVKTNGYADPDGKFLVDKVIALYPDKELMASLVNSCNKKTEENAHNRDEVIFQAYKCVQEQSPYDIYF